MLYVDVVSGSGDEVKQAPGLLVVMILKSDPQFRVLGKLVKYVAQNTKYPIQNTVHSGIQRYCHGETLLHIG